MSATRSKSSLRKPSKQSLGGSDSDSLSMTMRSWYPRATLWKQRASQHNYSCQLERTLRTHLYHSNDLNRSASRVCVCDDEAAAPELSAVGFQPNPPFVNLSLPTLCSRL